MQAILSPKKYLQTKARSLPIFECHINAGWQESGMVNIIISRKQPGGNFIVGIYLVDLYATGLKDTFHFFNLSNAEYEDLISEGKKEEYLESCAYPLAHNIIYEGIAYAEEFGFKPHKNFEYSKYILEEDTEDIEEIPIECGLDGKPCVVAATNDPKTKIITQLENTAGKGNFTLLIADEEEEDYDDDEDYEGPQTGDMEDQDEDLKIARIISETLMKVEETETFAIAAYEKYIGKGSSNNLLDADRLLPKVITEEDHFELDLFSENEMEEIAELDAAIATKQVNRKIINRLKTKIKKYPNAPVFYELLHSCYLILKKTRDSENMIRHAIDKFPDHLTIRLSYGISLIVNNQQDAFSNLFNGKFYLDEIAPGRTTYSVREVFHYLKMLLFYFMGKEDLFQASHIVQVMRQVKLDEEETVNLLLLRTLVADEMLKRALAVKNE